MPTVIDMSTGRKPMEPAEQYGEEVLLANWLPQPQREIALKAAVAAKTGLDEPPFDVEAFLRTIYTSQQ